MTRGYNPYRDGFRSVPDERHEEEMRRLRRAANANLANLMANRDKMKPEPKRKQKELDTATADEIERGHMVIERRMYNKLLGRILRKANMTDEELGAAEEYQAMVDKIDQELAGYRRPQLTRFVRLWNKSQKAKA